MDSTHSLNWFRWLPAGTEGCGGNGLLTADVLPRPSTRMRAGRRRAVVCTTSCLKLWRRYTRKRLLSCRVRYTHSQTSDSNQSAAVSETVAAPQNIRTHGVSISNIKIINKVRLLSNDKQLRLKCVWEPLKSVIPQHIPANILQ